MNAVFNARLKRSHCAICKRYVALYNLAHNTVYTAESTTDDIVKVTIPDGDPPSAAILRSRFDCMFEVVK